MEVIKHENGKGKCECDMEQLTNSHKYDDIIGLPHPVSVKHPQMAHEDRAAQFSPFAALTGYDAAISETQRLTERRRELDENKKAELDEKMADLVRQLDAHPVVRITYFKEDDKKDGGAYITTEGIVKKMKHYERILQMEDGEQIPISDVVEIENLKDQEA